VGLRNCSSATRARLESQRAWFYEHVVGLVDGLQQSGIVQAGLYRVPVGQVIPELERDIAVLGREIVNITEQTGLVASAV